MSHLKKQKLEMSPALRICTHSGSFHADESLAVFMLRLLPKFQNSTLVRSRDPAKWEESDIVVDVGGKYDGTKFFDHHQRGFEETFSPEYETKLSSAGLVYKHFGKEVIAQIIKTQDSKVLDVLYVKLYTDFVEAVDANDNGIAKYDEHSEQKFKDSNFSLASLVHNLNPIWTESDTDADFDRQFLLASEVMGNAFINVVKSYGLGWLPAKEIVEKAFNSRYEIHKSGKIMLFDQFVPWKDHLYNVENAAHKPSEILFVLFPDSSNKWRISTVPIQGAGFQNRRALPEELRGLRDEALSEKAGIEGCTFVHAAGFIGGANTKEAVIELAKKSL
jgi:uncharacterized UPF0160 family protein